jgi:hypothetical protein
MTATLLPEIARESLEAALRVVERRNPMEFTAEDLEELAAFLLSTARQQQELWASLLARLRKGMEGRELEARAGIILGTASAWLGLRDLCLKLASSRAGEAPEELRQAAEDVGRLRDSAERLRKQATAQRPPVPLEKLEAARRRMDAGNVLDATALLRDLEKRLRG